MGWAGEVRGGRQREVIKRSVIKRRVKGADVGGEGSEMGGGGY